MKIKKLITLFICYLTLLAFLGLAATGIVFSSGAQREANTLVVKHSIITKLLLTSEEECDPDDQFNHYVPGIPIFQHELNFFIFSKKENVTPGDPHKNQPALKTPIFISHRALRI